MHVAEAYSNDTAVKAFAATAIMKINAFEIAAGRKVDLLFECQSLVEELSASHSTDLQQRAYELQALIGLDAQAVVSIMPADTSCQDIEIDEDLSFLNTYVQHSIEKGAQPYIPDSERSGIFFITTTFRTEEQNEATHVLRFEAYELPKPPVPSTVVPLSSPTQLVSVPEPSYSRETNQAATPPSVLDTGSSELKLRLDGVQRKWGRPTYSSSPSSVSDTAQTSQKPINGVPQESTTNTSHSRARNTYDSRKPQVEISPEKQELAASLFGGTSKSEKKPFSNHKTTARASSYGAEESREPKSAIVASVDGTNYQPPDLLDLGETSVTSSAPVVDPFKQLEGLLDPTLVTSSIAHDAAGGSTLPNIVTLYADAPVSGQSSNAGISHPINGDIIDLMSGNSTAPSTDQSEVPSAFQMEMGKGPNPKDSLKKDAFVRKMGVTPTSQNPNMFRDLLG